MSISLKWGVTFCITTTALANLPQFYCIFVTRPFKNSLSFFVPRHRGCFDKISLDLPPFFYVFDPPFAKWPPCPSVFYVEFDRYQPIRIKNFRRRRRWLALRRPCFSLVSTGFCFQGFFSQCFALKIHSDFAVQDVKWRGFCHLFWPLGHRGSGPGQILSKMSPDVEANGRDGIRPATIPNIKMILNIKITFIVHREHQDLFPTSGLRHVVT